MKKRYDLITEAGQKIKTLVEENLKSFGADISSSTWQNYIEYLDEMVVEGFFQCILCSLNFMLTNTDSKLVSNPLFEARLELQTPEMVFVPSLSFNVPGGLYDMMEDILSDFYSIADFQSGGADDITLFKNGGGAHLDLMTSRYVLDRWRAAQ